jgi:hypothetical protein
VSAPRDPQQSDARRTSVRRTAWLLGAMALGFYVYAMFKVVSHGGAA